MSKQTNPFRWQVAKVGEAFKPPLILPSQTENEVRYNMGQQWAVDVLTSWLRAGRRELLSLEEVSRWPELLNLPVLDVGTPMSVVMFWAGVQSVMTYLINNTID